MPLLDFHPVGSSPKEKNRALILFLGIGALVGTLAFGSTLAANINLSDGGRFEFGQGVARTVVCGGSSVQVLLTPKSSFVNSAGTGRFVFSGLKLEEIPTGCLGTTFKFRAYSQSSNSPLALSTCASNGTYISTYFSGNNDSTGLTDSSINDFTDGVASLISKSSESFEIAWDGSCTGAPVGVSGISKITIESFTGPAPSDGSDLGGFTFVDCDDSSLAPCKLYGNALYATLNTNQDGFTTTFNDEENSGPLLRLCPSGYAVVGIKIGAGNYVGEVSPICAQYSNRSSEYVFTTWSLENSAFRVSEQNLIQEYRCDNGKWVTGFGGRAGAINDALQPICRTGSGRPATATLGPLFGGTGGGQINSKRCVQGEVVNGIWVWGLYNNFTSWGGTGGGEGLAFRCTKIGNL